MTGMTYEKCKREKKCDVFRLKGRWEGINWYAKDATDYMWWNVIGMALVSIMVLKI